MKFQVPNKKSVVEKYSTVVDSLLPVVAKAREDPHTQQLSCQEVALLVVVLQQEEEAFEKTHKCLPEREGVEVAFREFGCVRCAGFSFLPALVRDRSVTKCHKSSGFSTTSSERVTSTYIYQRNVQ